MKKLFLTLTMAMLLIFSLTACTTQQSAPESMENNENESLSVHFDWPHYNSIEELIERTSRYIVKVEVLDERTELINISLEPTMPSYNINTVHRLRVLEVFYGDTQPGEIIELAQLGGQLGNDSLYSHSFVPLVTGDELVMFLYGACPEEYSDFPAAKFTGLMNPTQGIYHIPATRDAGTMGAMTQDDSTVLESVHPENDLVLTIGDLARIAQENQQAE